METQQRTHHYSKSNAPAAGSSYLFKPIVTAREDFLRKLNLWGQLLLALVFTTAGTYGVTVAIPALYDSYAWRRAMQVIACFSFAELISHWCLTRFTDPAFHKEMCSLESAVSCSDHSHLQTSSLRYNTFYPAGGKSKNFNTQGSNSRVNQLGFSFTTDSDIGTLTNKGDPFDRNLNLRSASHQLSDLEVYSASFQDEIGKRRVLKCGSEGETNGILLDNLDELRIGKQTNASRHSWAWSYCSICGLCTPPRSRHCPLCRKCILKRHHHCFFTGVCIGAANQRHFIAFMFWGTFVCVFGTLHMLPYAFGHMISSGQALLWDIIPVVVFYRTVFGFTSVLLLVLCLTFWAVTVFTVVALLIFCRTVKLTALGLTDVEYDKNVKIVDARRLPERLRHVMGENWMLNFILPFRRKTLLREDAVHWPYIKRYS